MDLLVAALGVLAACAAWWYWHRLAADHYYVMRYSPPSANNLGRQKYVPGYLTGGRMPSIDADQMGMCACPGPQGQPPDYDEREPH